MILVSLGLGKLSLWVAQPPLKREAASDRKRSVVEEENPAAAERVDVSSKRCITHSLFSKYRNGDALYRLRFPCKPAQLEKPIVGMAAIPY